MKRQDRLLILNPEGQKIRDAEQLVSYSEGVMVVSVMDFVDGVIRTNSEKLDENSALRGLTSRIAAVVEPMLDKESGLLFGEALRAKMEGHERYDDKPAETDDL